MAYASYPMLQADEARDIISGNSAPGAGDVFLGAPSGGGAGAAPPAAGMAGGAGGGAAPAPTTQAGGSAALFSTPSGANPQERFFGDIGAGLQAGRSGLEEATGSFYGAAGPSRSWESSGAQDVFESFLGSPTTGGGDSTAEERARSFIDAAYSGPTSLGWTFEGAGDLQARQGALQTGGGLQNLIAAQNPALTPGMARFEAEQAWGDPRFHQRADQYESEIQEFFRDIGEERREAEAHAQQRTQEEQGIAERSRAFLGAREADVLGGLDERVQSAKERDAETARLHQGLMEGQPTVEELEGAGLGDLASDTYRRQLAVPQVREEIMARYQDLQDLGIEPTELIVTRKGREKDVFTWNGIPFKTSRAVKGKLTSKDLGIDEDRIRAAFGINSKEEERAFRERLAEVARRVDERQRELEAAFASPTRRHGRGEEARGKDIRRGHAVEPGEYRYLDPLYFGGALDSGEHQLPDPRNYIAPLRQGQATRQTVATEEETNYLNRIRSLLDQAEFIRSERPFEAAEIEAQVDQFLTDQEKALAARRGALDEASEAWRQRVKKARDQYRDRRREAVLAPLAAGAVGLGTLGIGSAVGAGLGLSGGGGMSGGVGRILG